MMPMAVLRAVSRDGSEHSVFKTTRAAFAHRRRLRAQGYRVRISKIRVVEVYGDYYRFRAR
jgi:hypothetical protein